jgi:hypothetical protein
MHGAHGFPGTAHLPYAWELAELFREGQGGDGRADACEELVAELRTVLLGDSEEIGSAMVDHAAIWALGGAAQGVTSGIAAGSQRCPPGC